MSVRRLATAGVVLTACALPLVVSSTASAARIHDRTAAARAARSLCAPPADTVGPVITKVTFGRSSIDLNKGSRVQSVTATASDTSGSGAPSGVSRGLPVSIRVNCFEPVEAETRLRHANLGSLDGPVHSLQVRTSRQVFDRLPLAPPMRTGNWQYYYGYGGTPSGAERAVAQPCGQPDVHRHRYACSSVRTSRRRPEHAAPSARRM